ncbi:MAG: aminotransferase class V-fold PLP-dependent enzyme [bacterium]|nr:aminotransferase class V-fold PLP-dependent enzyme [bacterium]
MSESRYIYLDNSATSWPKPPAVAEAMARFLTEEGGSAGRGSHTRAIHASESVFAAREAAARLLGVTRPQRICLGSGATWALNQALYGLLKPGDRVLACITNHNAVRRPLLDLARRGVIGLDWFAPADHTRPHDPADLDRLLAEKWPRMLCLNHVSNVLGTVQPLAELTSVAHAHGALVLADIAQASGVVPLELERWGVDVAAFTGHKGMLGPQGTGGLYAAPGVEPIPLMRGGGGTPIAEDMPEELPERLECGTYNVVGLVGFTAGIGWVLDRGMEALHRQKTRLLKMLLDILGKYGARLLGPPDIEGRVPLAAFTIPGRDVNRLAADLEERGGIQVRTGLHCAPGAHELAGTRDTGAVRVSLGPFNTEDDLDVLDRTLGEILK